MDLPYRVTIERATETQDATGAAIPTWGPLAVRWAAIDPVSGREFFAVRQVNAEVTHRLRFRADAVTRTVTPKDRVRLGTRLFDLEDVHGRESRSDAIECLAREVV